jgi:hypothetical protein
MTADVFRDAIKDPDVEDLGRALPVRLADLVADRAARCLSTLRLPD